MIRKWLLLGLLVAAAACGDDGSHMLADAPLPPDAAIDAPGDVELSLELAGNGAGTVTSEPAGLECSATCTATFAFDTVVTLTAEPAEGSVFGGWSGACSGTEPTCEVTLAEAAEVTATFMLATYTVTVEKTGAGTGTVTGDGFDCGATCTATIEHGTEITLEATPAALSVFAGWGGPCSGTGTCVVTVTEDVTITAGFSLDDFTLMVTRAGTGAGTVTSTPAGISCGADCDETFQANQMVTLTATPSTGSTFAGWSGGGCGGTGTCTVTLTAAAVVTATFTLDTYPLTVTKTGSGTGTVASSPAGIACGADCDETYDHGTSVTLTATAAAGSSFTGWSGACSHTMPTCVVSMTQARSLTATFALNTYALTVATTGSGTVSSAPAGITCGADCSETYTHGTIVTLTATPAMGWSFAGWGGACSGTSTTCAVTMTQARDVTATFTINTYNLIVTKAGTGAGTVTSSPAGISCGDDCTHTYEYGTIVTLTQAPASGSTFTGWGGPCVGTTPTCIVSMTQVRNVTATFTLNTYALTVGTTGSGTVSSTPAGISCGADCSETYNHGTSVTLTATPATGWSFTGWGGACSGTSTTCAVSMTQARDVTATFTINTYALAVTKAGTGTGTVSSAPAGISCGADCSEAYAHGTSVTLTAAPATGSTFTGWSGACSGTSTTCTVSMTQARNVTATFTLNTYALTVSRTGTGTGTVTSSPAGINCGADCSETYNHGASVTLTATPAAGSAFTGWSGACSGTSTTCVVAMTQARTATATFALQSHNLTVTVNGTGFGRVTSSPAGVDCPGDCAQSYSHGTTVTLTATPSTGDAQTVSSFVGWSGACSGTGPCTVTLTQATSVIALFELAPNVMFVTSATLNGSLGGIAGADARCQDYAAGAGLVGNGVGQNQRFRAWLSAPGAHAAARMGSASGWVRRDGKPVFDRVQDIAANNIIYPPRLTETGQDVGQNFRVWTGTMPDGTYGGACSSPTFGNSEWNTTSGTAIIGTATGNSASITAMASTSCANVTAHLYCMGIDRAASVEPPAAVGRLAFTSRGLYIPDSSGIAKADGICQAEATEAGLPGTYRALLATLDTPAIRRFTESSRPWVRVGDRVPLTEDPLGLFNPQLPYIEAAPNVYANGTRIFDGPTWTGSGGPALVGNQGYTCDDWTSPQVKGAGGRADETEMIRWFGPGPASSNPCDSGRRVMCLQQ